MNLVKRFRAEVIKYNLGEPFWTYGYYYDNRPDVFDLEKLLDTVNETYPSYKSYHTRIEVIECYDVVNSKIN